MTSHDAIAVALDRLWAALPSSDVADRPPIALRDASDAGLPSRYPVDVFAAATVAAAVAAIADLARARGLAGANIGGAVDRLHASVAFRSERFAAIRVPGAPPPAIWDPIAGDYPSRDGWVRIHTNYPYHRDAALAALACAPTREAVAAAISARTGDDVEAAIVAAGGAAARMRTAQQWAEHPAGAAVAREPLVAVEWGTAAPARAGVPAGVAPLAGLRVLDLTRVIAGPVASRTLAAYGADVLRIDPPGFAEVPALIADTTAGKRRAALDLRTADGRARMLELVAGADVLLCGYRADALDRLGLADDRLRAAQPSLVIARLDAYGWTGPWRTRRGFDSLVQMSCGIAAAATGGAPPSPLPAQALDHGAGYLLAAAAGRALASVARGGRTATVRLSLARVAHELVSLPADPNAAHMRDLTAADAAPYLVHDRTGLGADATRVRCPGELDGFAPRWTVPPGALGIDEPRWLAAP